MSAKPTRPSGGMSSYRALGLGLELGASVGGMAILGYLADRQFGTTPWLALTGSFLGIAGGVYNVVRAVMGASGKRPRPTAEGQQGRKPGDADDG